MVGCDFEFCQSWPRCIGCQGVGCGSGLCLASWLFYKRGCLCY
jgi:hypothetical protein